MPRLTKTVVDQFAATRDTTLGDTLLPGFGVRLRPPNPQKVFYVQYRTPTGQRRRKLGVQWRRTVDEARETARQWLAQVAMGHDPAVQHDAPRVITLHELAQRYLTMHAQPKKKATSLRNDQWLLRCHVLPAAWPPARCHPAAGRHRAGASPPRRHADYGQPGIGAAFHHVRLAEQWGLRDAGNNPVLGIPRYRERPRERYLTPAELTRLWEVLARAERTQSESAVGLAALRLLLLTGARVGEILTLCWDMIDWEHGRARLPDQTGAKTLYLAPQALDVLRRLPRRVGSPWCFPSHQPGSILWRCRGCGSGAG